MRSFSFVLILSAVLVLCFSACGSSDAKKVVGKYTMQGWEAAGIYEFASDNRFVNEASREGCMIRSVGTWMLDGSKLTVKLDKSKTEYRFDDSFTAEEKEQMQEFMAGVMEEAPDSYEYVIDEIGDDVMKVSLDGTTFTFVRQ